MFDFKFRRNLNDKVTCDEGNRQCNIGNLLKIGIIPSHTNKTWYVQQHTTPQIIKSCP